MTKRNAVFFFSLILFASASFTTCNWENPVMDKWWVDEKPAEPSYVGLIKYIPEIYYEEIIKDNIVYETIHDTITVQLPPEIIYEMVYIELPPQVITQIITEIEYVEVETIVEKLVEKEVPVPTPPDRETFIEWLNGASDEDKQVVKEIVKEYLTEQDIIEIIQKTPPDVLIKYLTDEQIKYIIQQQPPAMLLQSIKIIDIEYIIFAGDSSVYNDPNPPNAGSALTAQAKATNNSIVNAAIKTLRDDPDCLVLLHGHANPVTGTQAETDELEALSLARADAVKAQIHSVASDVDLGRIDTKGFAGEGNIVSSTSNADLNRRVEVIIFKLDTTQISSGG